MTWTVSNMSGYTHNTDLLLSSEQDLMIIGQ